MSLVVQLRCSLHNSKYEDKYDDKYDEKFGEKFWLLIRGALYMMTNTSKSRQTLLRCYISSFYAKLVLNLISIVALFIMTNASKSRQTLLKLRQTLQSQGKHFQSAELASACHLMLFE